jgi:hypothetical protein
MTSNEEFEDVSGVAEENYGTINIGTGAIDPAELRARPFTPNPEHYLAVLLVESRPSAGEPLYQESFVLLTAESRAEAAEKAREHGKQLEATYEDENHQPVSWKLKRIAEVRRVEDATFDDGSELYTRFFSSYESYRAIGFLEDDED